MSVAIDSDDLARCVGKGDVGDRGGFDELMDACLQGELCDGHAKIELVSRQAAGVVEYAVIDTCDGMDEEVRAKIFNAFFTTKGSRGTGIGLMLTRRIVEAHGGAIHVTSEKGQGSKFVITLPYPYPYP